METLRRQRVLVLRARGQASALAELLLARGLEAGVVPAIEIVEPETWDSLDAALGRVGEFAWVVFASANAVAGFARRAGLLGVRLDRLGKIAVVGSATARAVEAELGRGVDAMPERFVAEELAGCLAGRVAQGDEVLVVRAAVAREVLVERLVALRALVTVAEAYRNVVPSGSVAQIRELFAADRVDAVAFTSGSTAVNLRGLLDEAGVSVPDGVVMASIGPVTSAAMRDAGFGVSVQAREATIAGLVRAIEEGLSRKG